MASASARCCIMLMCSRTLTLFCACFFCFFFGGVTLLFFCAACFFFFFFFFFGGVGGVTLLFFCAACFFFFFFFFFGGVGGVTFFFGGEFVCFVIWLHLGRTVMTFIISCVTTRGLLHAIAIKTSSRVHPRSFMRFRACSVSWTSAMLELAREITDGRVLGVTVRRLCPAVLPRT